MKENNENNPLEAIQETKKHENISFRKKVEKGLRISFKKLVEQKRKDNDELVVSEDGEIKFIDPQKVEV